MHYLVFVLKNLDLAIPENLLADGNMLE